MKVKPWIMYDMAHVLGLVGPYFQQPFQEGADLVTVLPIRLSSAPRGSHRKYLDESSEDYDLWKAITRRTFSRQPE